MLSAAELIWNQPAPLVTVAPSLKRDVGSPGGGRRLEQRDAAGVRRRHGADVHRPRAPVVLARAVVGLELGDQRPALGRAPALAAHRRPLVEVLLGRPEGDARVVRRAPAEHLGAGVAQERVALLLRLDQVVPVIARVEQVHPVLEREDRLVVDVGRPGLDQADRDRGVLAEAGREHAARGPASGDDVVELARVDHRLLPLRAHGAISPSPTGVRRSNCGSARWDSITSIGLLA